MNRSKGFRALVGLAALVALLVAAFSTLRPWVPTWGSTGEERSRAMPGDDIAVPPLVVSWTHGITVRAAPETVWPWIVQMGDVRGGFYSYTFIENFIAPEEYRNADRIVPELQNPVPGTAMIGQVMRMREIAPNRHLLAAFEIPDLAMSWVWALYPQEQGTRLVVRMRGRSELKAPGLLMSAASFFVNYGGFVMERRMMQGIKDRAEGRIEPPWYQGAEIALWLLAFALGVAAAVAYMGRWAWWRGLAVGLASVVFLLFLTYIQPPLWARIPLLVVQAAAVGWALRSPPMPRRRRAKK
jgi:hypothetical protein